METRIRVSRCTSTPPRETKVCPVCDSTIDADARRCEFCQTDLSLFDVGSNSFTEGSESHASDARTIDEILASITGGSEDQPEIFETLKSVAKSSHAADDLLMEEKPEAVKETKAEAAAEHFVCPVCETSVASDAAVCPGCGAQFAEGEATEFECPVCKATVAGDANQCPSCGVRFAPEEETPPETESHEPIPPGGTLARVSPTAPPVPPATARADLLITFKDRLVAVRHAKRESTRQLPLGDRKLMYRELPKLVNDVKALLVSAKRMGLQIEGEKRLINDAIVAGKGHDVEKAVTMISEAKHALDIAFTDFIAGRMDAFAQEVRAAGTKDASDVEAKLQEAVDLLEAGNYDGAWDRFQATTKGFQAQAKEYHEARDALNENERLIAEMRSLNMDVREVERLVRMGREAMERRDQAGAVKLAKQARDRLDRDIPHFVEGEMKKARNTLLDLKVRGGDLSKPIGILKVASVHVKKEEWTEAVRYLKEFRKDMDNL